MRLAARGLFALALALSATGARAAIRQFSYSPADEATRLAAGPVTLVIDQTLLGEKVLKLRSTVANATADLARTDARAVGLIELGRQPGDAASLRDLYRVLPRDDGPAFVEALCPGSKRAWLALTAPHYGADLQAIVLGDDPKGGPVHRCKTLDFNFYGEWRAVSGAPPSLEADSPPDFPN